MRKALGDIAVSDLPRAVRGLWYTRNDEPESEEFRSLPEWMWEASEPPLRRDQERVVAYLLSTLTEREEAVLRLRVGHDYTLEEVARVFGVTRERIRQIEAKAFRKLRHPSRTMVLALAFDLPDDHRKWLEEKWAKANKANEVFTEWLAEADNPKNLSGIALM